MKLTQLFCRKYPIQRITQALKVPYYVKKNFHTEYQGSVQRLEMSVEEEHVTNLQHACYREKNYRKCFHLIYYNIISILVHILNMLKNIFGLNNDCQENHFFPSDPDFF